MENNQNDKIAVRFNMSKTTYKTLAHEALRRDIKLNKLIVNMLDSVATKIQKENETWNKP